MIWGHDHEKPPWYQACIEGFVIIADIVSIVGLVGMVDVVGLVETISKYRRYSRQGRQSLAWDNKTVTLLCIPEQPVFNFVYIAFTIKQVRRHRGHVGAVPPQITACASPSKNYVPQSED